jgi:hypothetical protein
MELAQIARVASGRVVQQHMELEDRISQQDFKNFDIPHMGQEARKFQRTLCTITQERGGKMFSLKKKNNETYRRHVVLKY